MLKFNVCLNQGNEALNTGKVNTDHQYKGIRWYFASDPIWQEKIGHEII